MIIEQASSDSAIDSDTLNARRPWNRGLSALPSKRTPVEFTLTVREGKDKTLSPVPVTLDEIDQRTKALLSKRVSTAVFKDRLSGTMLGAAQARAHLVRLKGEINLVILTPTEGTEEQRLAIRSVLSELRELTASRGIYLRLVDLSGCVCVCVCVCTCL